MSYIPQNRLMASLENNQLNLITSGDANKILQSHSFLTLRPHSILYTWLLYTYSLQKMKHTDFIGLIQV